MMEQKHSNGKNKWKIFTIFPKLKKKNQFKYDICSIVPLTVDITVGPEVNAYTLGGLKGGTEYEIQISGFTRTGEGAPTRASLFTTTEHQGLHCTRFIAYRDRLHATRIPYALRGSFSPNRVL